MKNYTQYMLMNGWELTKLAFDGDRIARYCLRIYRSLDWIESEHPRGEGGQFREKGESGLKPTPKLIRSDATAEYKSTSRPGSGEVILHDGYKLSKHHDEINTAFFLRDTFGGDVELIPESKGSSQKTPDFMWRGQSWELKIISSVKAADGAIRKALLQLGGSGGIILRYPIKGVDRVELGKAVDYRVRRSYKGDVDVMLLQGDSCVSVLRYKK